MLGSLRTFISGRNEKSDSRKQLDTDTQLSAAALLVRLATVDRDLSGDRRAKLCRILETAFELDDVAAARLADEAVVAERRAIDLYRFTRRINDTCDDAMRGRVVQMLWQMAYADGNLNGFEANLIWRVADLLGVPSRRRIEIGQHVAATDTPSVSYSL
jgi:uncharacterized tellurite resistance protein B-like protein